MSSPKAGPTEMTDGGVASRLSDARVNRKSLQRSTRGTSSPTRPDAMLGAVEDNATAAGVSRGDAAHQDG